MAKKKVLKRKSNSGRQPLRGERKEVLAITLTPEAIEFINSLDKSRGEAVEDILRESESFRQWRSRGKKFAWDKFLGQCLYRDLRELLPSQWPTVPSMYSPDRSFYYASSIDLDVDTKDPVKLQVVLNALTDRLKRKNIGRLKLILVWFDVAEITGLMKALGMDVANPEDFF